jgi:hypothetical protein
MTTPEAGYLQNLQQLATTLTALRQYLHRQLLTWQGESPLDAEDQPPGQTDTASAPELDAHLAAENLPPALVLLGQRLGLTSGEQHLLLLCAALELDPAMATLCAQTQQLLGQSNSPTLALAQQLFDDIQWETLLPDRPLRYWQLIEIHQPGAQPLLHSPLRIDERVVSYLRGVNYLDDRLDPFVLPLPAVEPAGAAAQQRTVTDVVHRLQMANAQSQLPLVQLLGGDAQSQQQVVSQVAQQLGLQPYRLPLALLPKEAGKLDTFLRLWQRETVLSPVTLYIAAHDLDTEPPEVATRSWLTQFLTRCQSLGFIGTQRRGQPWGRPTLDVEVTQPTQAEQLQAWSRCLGDADQATAQRLAGQFNLPLPTIETIAQACTPAAEAAEESERPYPQRLWQACLTQTQPGLDALAQRLDPRATWADIVLPQKELALLHQLTDQVQYRTQVYQSWGFGDTLTRGQGINALFAGPSGTGKTMAAEVIANALNLNLYRIDLSAVVSKYIGETEKNLRRLFDTAEAGGAILFFDEADALFGKRSEVKDSHDRYANIEINYLLQRMEAYQGLAILATNFKRALDAAFVRRLRFIVNFPFPHVAERDAIWQRAWPAATPRAGLDYAHLAQFTLTGGSIHNIALNAAFLAARVGTPVTMPLVFEAIRTELDKLETPINEAQFAWSGVEALGNGHRPVGSTQASP